ncbi:MAG: polysaccharide export protein, partial [Bdellovibrionales bacterium]|nr:polysaccharide export protein [Bdellovibrionales bacterium]
MKPRSELIAEAEEDGIVINSVAEDFARFTQREEEMRARLSALVADRREGSRFEVDYRIGPGDEIEVHVFEVEELNTSVRVSQAGFVELPLVGSLKAEGLTQSEFEKSLQSSLAKFVRNPQVSALITVFASQEVAVMGAVQRPGRYSLKKGQNSLLELLSAAGGPTDRAGNFINLIPKFSNTPHPDTAITSEEVRAAPDQSEMENVADASNIAASALQSVVKTSDGEKENGNGTSSSLVFSSRATELSHPDSIDIYLDDVYGNKGGLPLDVPVYGGDMIVVPEAGRVVVEGEVEKTGAYELGKRTTLLGALAAAGGITYASKPDEVELIRPARNGEQLRLVVDLEQILNGSSQDVPVRNGDIVRVPSHSGRRMRQDTFDGIARITNFG